MNNRTFYNEVLTDHNRYPGPVSYTHLRAAEGIMKEDSGCRKRFRNGGSYG